MQRCLPETKKLKALMLQLQLSQLIKKPTKIAATSSTLKIENSEAGSFVQVGQKRVGNCRPISILPVSKIVEKEVHCQMYSFFVEHNLPSPSQHGFRQKRSTQYALLNVVHQWLKKYG